MISADDFRAAFSDDGVVTFAKDVVHPLGLPSEQADWLVNVGLPRSAAPFLDFGDKAEQSLPSVASIYGVRDPAIAERYCVIGSNGNGDPVVLDLEEGGAVAFLNHDNDMCRVFMNSSVVQLVECLVAFKRLIHVAQATNGDDAYLDGNIPPDALAEFIEIVRACDSPALEQDSMWGYEIQGFTH